MQMRMTFSTLTALMRLLLVLPLLLLAGCGAAATADHRITVVATTTQVADFARHVGGDRVDVVQILAPNTDPHEYELRPQDVKSVADADVVLRSGGDVDEWIGEAIEGSGTKAPVVDLSRGVALHGDDPHWWQDPRNAVRAVYEIRTALSKADPTHDYDPAAEAYAATLTALDHSVRTCISHIPAAQRKLVTT